MPKHVESTFLVALKVLASSLAQKGPSSLAEPGTGITNLVIPASSVTLTNEASGDRRTGTTNGQGEFVFASVNPGTYNTSFNGREPLSGYDSNLTIKDDATWTNGTHTFKFGAFCKHNRVAQPARSNFSGSVQKITHTGE